MDQIKFDKRELKQLEEIESRRKALNNSDEKKKPWYLKVKTVFYIILIGIIPWIIGLYHFYISEVTLNELGDFLAGTTGLIWAVAGIYLIYLTFQGQKEQIVLQQLELLDNREEMLYTRLEMRAQNESLQNQTTQFKTQSETAMKALKQSQLDFKEKEFQFKMDNLKSNRELVKAKTKVGVEAIHEIYREINGNILNMVRDKDRDNAPIHHTDYVDVVRNTFMRYDLRSYWNSMYEAIKSFDSSENVEYHKAIFLSNLTSYDFTLLVYLVNTNEGNKFVHYFKEHALYKEIDRKLVREKFWIEPFV
ncbi:hypothetical protein GYB22_12715 [bacterium]|nr:hypothetical protein [bacterium]